MDIIGAGTEAAQQVIATHTGRRRLSKSEVERLAYKEAVNAMRRFTDTRKPSSLVLGSGETYLDRVSEKRRNASGVGIKSEAKADKALVAELTSDEGEWVRLKADLRQEPRALTKAQLVEEIAYERMSRKGGGKLADLKADPDVIALAEFAYAWQHDNRREALRASLPPSRKWEADFPGEDWVRQYLEKTRTGLRMLIKPNLLADPAVVRLFRDLFGVNLTGSESHAASARHVETVRRRR